MKHTKLKLSIVFLIGLGLTGIQAQESVNATGGNASGSGGSASYSVGQMVYTTNVGINGNSMAQGVQQPYEISIVTGTPEAQGISLTVSAYPNPTTDYLTVKVDASTSLSIQSLQYVVFDTNGKLLQIIKATGMETKIDINSLVPANYFVKVFDSTKELKTFKIIKN